MPLFLTDSEKTTLGPFINSPFINYNKSKELCEKHAKSRLHLLANERAYTFKSTYNNPERSIDSLVQDANSRHFKFNSKVLPIIVETVITCARQRIALQGHH